MGKTLTLKERKVAEDKMFRLVFTKKLTVREIADKLGVTPQAVRKFLKVRGWVAKAAK